MVRGTHLIRTTNDTSRWPRVHTLYVCARCLPPVLYWFIYHSQTCCTPARYAPQVIHHTFSPYLRPLSVACCLPPTDSYIILTACLRLPPVACWPLPNDLCIILAACVCPPSTDLCIILRCLAHQPNTHHKWYIIHSHHMFAPAACCLLPTPYWFIYHSQTCCAPDTHHKWNIIHSRHICARRAVRSLLIHISFSPHVCARCLLPAAHSLMFYVSFSLHLCVRSLLIDHSQMCCAPNTHHKWYIIHSHHICAHRPLPAACPLPIHISFSLHVCARRPLPAARSLMIYVSFSLHACSALYWFMYHSQMSCAPARYAPQVIYHTFSPQVCALRLLPTARSLLIHISFSHMLRPPNMHHQWYIITCGLLPHDFCIILTACLHPLSTDLCIILRCVAHLHHKWYIIHSCRMFVPAARCLPPTP